MQPSPRKCSSARNLCRMSLGGYAAKDRRVQSATGPDIPRSRPQSDPLYSLSRPHRLTSSPLPSASLLSSLFEHRKLEAANPTLLPILKSISWQKATVTKTSGRRPLPCRLLPPHSRRRGPGTGECFLDVSSVRHNMLLTMQPPVKVMMISPLHRRTMMMRSYLIPPPPLSIRESSPFSPPPCPWLGIPYRACC
jgi:hypothetical protein